MTAARIGLRRKIVNRTFNVGSESRKPGFNMKSVRIISLVVVALSSCSLAAQNSGDRWWPQFRGPNSSGIGAGKPPVHFGSDQNVQWKAAVGPGLSSPIIWADRIFLTEVDQGTQKLATLCIDRRTGKVKRLNQPGGPNPKADPQRLGACGQKLVEGARNLRAG